MNKLNQFLKKGWKEAVMVSLESDILRIASVPIADPPTAQIFLFEETEHLRKERSGKISVARGSIPFKIEFSLDYLQSGDLRVTVLDATLLYPDTDFYHPKLDPANGIISLGGNVLPATPLPMLLLQLYEVLTYQHLDLRAGSAVNPAACRYLSDHPEVVSGFRVQPLIRRRFGIGGVDQKSKGREHAPASIRNHG
jgi:hypothetical protein